MTTAAGRAPASATSSGESRRRPGPQSKLDIAREALIVVATESLLTRGVEVGLGQITLSETIAASGIARATAYRSLADTDLDPQELLRREVSRRVLSRATREATHEAVASAVAKQLEQASLDLDSDDIAVRTRAARSLIRVGCEASFRDVSGSTERAILVAAYGALSSQGTNAPNWQREALEEGEAAMRGLFADLYSAVSDLVGYELRPEYTEAQFATASAALVEGLSMRAVVNDATGGIMRPTGPDGAAEEWTLFGIAFEALYLQFYSPSNPENPIVDLARY